jgi:uncharacterized membrane protein
MKVHHFLNSVDHQRVHEAIQKIEKDTSGKIVVYVSRQKVLDAMEAGHRAFRKLGLEKAGQQASFLLFLAPKARKFAVIGGTALHEKVGQLGWDALVDRISRHFRQDRFTDGLLAAVEDIGRRLKADFPPKGPSAAGGADIVED